MSCYTARIESYRTTPLGVTYYTIKVRDLHPPGTEWTIERRFRDFVALRDVLRQLHASTTPNFPGKSVFAYFASDSFLIKRANRLNDFMASLFTNLEPDPQSIAMRTFFRISRPCSSPSLSPSLVHANEVDIALPEDAAVEILSFLDSKDILRLSSLSKACHRSSVSPSLWKRVRVKSRKFESIQKHFLRFLVNPGISEGVQEINAEVQFSQHISHNLALSLPGNMHFSSLNKLSFNSLRIAPSTFSACSSASLCGELLEAILADLSPIRSIRVRTEVSPDMLKSLLGICRHEPIESLHVTFLGSPVQIGESEFRCLVDTLGATEKSVRELDIRVEYPESWVGDQLYPDAVFGERIGHFSHQSELVKLISTTDAFPQLRRLCFPFLSVYELLRANDFRLPRNLEELDLRFVVDGLTSRRNIDRSNHSVLKDVLSACPTTIKSLKLVTIGSDETDQLNPNFMPFAIHSQAINYDVVADAWLEDWRPKMLSLERLTIEGLHIGMYSWLTFLVRAGRFVDFLSLFPRLRCLRLVNCVSSLDESSVLSIFDKLHVLEELVLLGPNEKLTDSLLCNLERIQHVRLMMKRLIIPKTRYMSSIGVEAVNRIESTNPNIHILLDNRPIVTGRSYET
jgi:hypothetical protein